MLKAIKLLADVQKVSTYDDVVTFMGTVADELARQRGAVIIGPQVDNFSMVDVVAEVGQKAPDVWHLHLSPCWQGDLKQNQTIQDGHQIQQDVFDDLAAAFQTVLEANGFTVLTLYLKQYV